MQQTSDIDRIALLLTGLGSELTEPALANLDSARAEKVRARLKVMEADPPETDVLNEVMDDFSVFMKFALQTANAPSNWADDEFGVVEGELDSSDDGVPLKGAKLKIFQPTDDPVEDLQRLEAGQIAGAIADEVPRTIGIVLSCLSQAKTAEVLGLLPDDLQSQAFLALQKNKISSPELIARVAKTTVQKAALIQPGEFESNDSDQQMADLLRSMPKETRNRLMQHLEESEPEMAERLRDLLYVFDDVLLYDNRSVQKLLAQIETPVLISALQDVDAAVNDRIFDNLSKRAKLSLNEEIEFARRASDAEVIQARKTIAKVIAQLDRDGEMVEQ